MRIFFGITANFQIYALRKAKLYDIRKAIYATNIKYYFDKLIISFIQSYFGQTYLWIGELFTF